ncbi:MAG: 30S ribosomal protein S12 methylthiotransferase RimO [Candidatus Aphodosoma sp.]
MQKNRVDVISLGCYKNLVDSEKLMRLFKNAGFKVFHDSDKVCGEFVVVNTCGFIGDAKQESIDIILELTELKKRGRIGKLIVMGCLSERYIHQLEQEIPEVDAYYGKFNWSDMIDDFVAQRKNEKSSKDLRVVTTPSHYAYLKIAEGCNRTCSYCAIPIITGAYKSRDIESIVDEAKWLAHKGVKELQLIAQDLTYYGLDLYHEHKLPELVSKLSEINGIEWIRLHYGYPNNFPYQILDVMRDNPKVCSYFDIALQHISDNMLKLMRRNLTKQDTLRFIENVRKAVPGIHLRTTLLVGHPGETEEDFNELIDFVETQKFERLGVFAYSHEEGTYSYKNYSDDIPEEVKQSRVDKIMSLQEKISQSIAAEKVGSIMRVIIDREDPDFYVARTEFDSPEVDGEVYIDKKISLTVGDFYNVEIIDSDVYDLFAKLVE